MIMKKWIRPAALVLACLLVLSLCGCGLLDRFLPDFDFSLPAFGKPSAASESKTEIALQEKAVLGNYHVRTDELGQVSMTAQVTIPDYSYYMAQALSAAEAKAKSEEEFEKVLYNLVLEAAESTDTPVSNVQEITVDLTDLNPEKVQADWMYEELIAISQDMAFEREVEEFCLELLAAYYPTGSEVPAP